MSLETIKLEQLNEFQREAVLDESPALLVKANVGSGKTTVLIAKILYLFEEQRAPLKEMAVLTFTNKAAWEIKDRLLALKPDLTKEDLSGFGTFHSVAMSLLKERLPIERTGWTRDFVIITPEEEQGLALRLIKEKKLKIKYKNRLLKRMETEIFDFCAGKETSRYQDDLFLLFSLLEEEKKRENKMSFRDLIQVSTKLLGEGNCTFSWVIVDEVQDSDKEQVEFLTAFMGEHTRFFAVGDPNQLIYSWRGSVETVFYLLKDRFSARELSLPVNYRSSDVILKASRRFLQFGCDLVGSHPKGELIRVCNHYDPFQEAEYLSERVKSLQKTGIAYGDIAVFYRLKNQSEVLEKVFLREGIPFSVTQKKTVKDIPVLDWFRHVLLFSVNPKDLFAKETVLSHPVYGETIKKGESILYGQMEGFLERFSGKDLECLTAEEIYAYFKLDTYLHPNRASYPEDQSYVLKFCQRLIDFCRENREEFATGTREFLCSSALYGTAILKTEENPGREKVRLMTIHASKGLEFPYVFIIGVNQGIIPLKGQGFEGEEEERRLFFVGLTRAMEHLELSYYTNPGLPGTEGGPGRYLQMLPEDLLDWEGRRTEEEKRANLKMLTRAVRENRNGDAAPDLKETVYPDAALTMPETEKPRKARHPKYGLGTLVGENELTVEVDFPSYGRKEFLKAFGEVEIL